MRWKKEKERTCCPHEVPVSNSMIRKKNKRHFGEMPGSNGQKPLTRTGMALNEEEAQSSNGWITLWINIVSV